MSDKEQIESVVQLYIDSMDESSADKVKEAFHPNASVVGYLHGDFMEMLRLKKLVLTIIIFTYYLLNTTLIFVCISQKFCNILSNNLI